MKQLEHLNKKQLEAVTSVDSHVRIVAGAGSGKTRVVTTRIAYLIEEIGILPHRILAITFTNKAANEMKERVSSIMNCGNSGVKVSTIHSLCVRILREDIRHLNYPQNFTILDSDDQKTILKTIYKQLDLNIKDISLNQSLGYISNNKCAFVGVEEAQALANTYTSEVYKAQIYDLYTQKLKEMYALDFDDLILFVHNLFEHNEEVRRKWQNRFDYIHVDEFQDVDVIQYGIIKNLVKEDTKLCVVGDPDQTIYTWRGADVDIIMNFETDFNTSKSIVLNENYRSTPSILQGANSLIKNNTYRIDKDLYTNNKGSEKITHYLANDENDESIWIAKKIKQLHNEGLPYKDVAILYRSNYLSRGLEKAFLDYQIPYRIYGGTKFFERAEIKDAISYLRLLLVNNDAIELAIRRVINVPRRGVGPKAMSAIEQISDAENSNFYEVIKNHTIARGVTQNKVNEFVNLVEKYRVKTKDYSISILIKGLLEESGYYRMLEDNQESERLENLMELVADIERYENEEDSNLEEYLQMISLYTDTSNENEGTYDYVQMMSIHAAKGLEFDNVFVYELSEGVFPNEKSVNEGGKHALEEERRLAYVAYTRARKKLYITSSQGYSFVLQKIKTVSRFVKEIDEDVIDKLNQQPSYQNQEYKYNKGDAAIRAQKPLTSTTNASKVKLKKGELISHTVFGDGVILSSKDGVVEIAFDRKYGIRKLSAIHPSISKK